MPAEKIKTKKIICLYCQATFQTDDPKNFKMPEHANERITHRPPCQGSRKGDNDFTWEDKFKKKNPSPLTLIQT